MEVIDSSSSTCSLQLPPGFRFHPTDEELVVHYLKKKSNSLPLPASIIAEIDLYKFDPWELPAKASFGEDEWYFFSPRDRKYPNGARPNRAATSGYWKATGTDKPVLTARGTQKVGVKKALVFYQGKPPKGIKTNWIMHEYRLMDHSNKASYSLKPPSCDQLLHRKGGSLRLDDWVLCRIYKKNIAQRPLDSMEIREDNEMMMGPNSIVPSLTMSQDRSLLFQGGGVVGNNSNSYASNDHQQQHAYNDMVFPAKRGLHSLYNNNWSSEAANQHDQNLMKGNSDLTHHQLPQSSSDEAVLGSGINVGEEGVLPQQHESYEVPGINCWYST